MYLLDRKQGVLTTSVHSATTSKHERFSNVASKRVMSCTWLIDYTCVVYCRKSKFIMNN